MMKYVGIMIGGIALGIIADRIILAIEDKQKTDREKILEKCFGEPMYTSVFSINEVRDWIQTREDSLKNGAKAIVLKANAETLKRIGEDLDIGTGVKNNIVIAIVDGKTSNIVDSALIKYESLDPSLENALSKGNGILVVEA